MLVSFFFACYCLVVSQMEGVFPLLLRCKVFLVANARALCEWKPTPFLTLIIPQSSWSKHTSFLEETITFQNCRALTSSVASIWNTIPSFHCTRLRFIYLSDTHLMRTDHGPRIVLASGDRKMNYSVLAFEKLTNSTMHY